VVRREQHAARDTRPILRCACTAPSEALSMGVRQPFTQIQLQKPSVIQRLLRRQPRENAFIEINNLMARARQIRAVTGEDVVRICEAHRTDLKGPLGSRTERLYRDYLIYCLEDRHLNEDELSDLAHLKKVLKISNEATAAIHEYVARQVYCKTVAEVLADGVIDESERDFLARLQQSLSLSGRAATRIMEAKLQQRGKTH
jgi:hypothetical protein